jgi:phage tail sheath gpL-like
VAFTDPATVSNPSNGLVISVAWGDVVNADLNDLYARLQCTIVRVNGTLNGAGGGAFAHGAAVAGGAVLGATAFYKGASGEAIPLPVSYVDGTNVGITNTAAAAGKSVVIGLVVSDTGAGTW